MADTFTPEQITQILEEFFKVVGTRKYIGERYVPIFGRKGEESIQWDNSAPYEPLTIVLYQGNSYTSRQYVPIGIEITNQEFWVITGNYNAQVEAYHRETITAREIADNAITTANNAITTANNAQNDIDTLLPKADFSAENTVKKYIDENPTRILTFDTVADMQAATYLKNGMTCYTNGFHATGDGGAAYYKVSASGTANGTSVIACVGGLFAHFVPTTELVSIDAYPGETNEDKLYAALDAVTSGTIVCGEVTITKVYNALAKDYRNIIIQGATLNMTIDEWFNQASSTYKSVVQFNSCVINGNGHTIFSGQYNAVGMRFNGCTLNDVTAYSSTDYYVQSPYFNSCTMLNVGNLITATIAYDFKMIGCRIESAIETLIKLTDSAAIRQGSVESCLIEGRTNVVFDIGGAIGLTISKCYFENNLNGLILQTSATGQCYITVEECAFFGSMSVDSAVTLNSPAYPNVRIRNNVSNYPATKLLCSKNIPPSYYLGANNKNYGPAKWRNEGHAIANGMYQALSTGPKNATWDEDNHVWKCNIQLPYGEAYTLLRPIYVIFAGSFGSSLVYQGYAIIRLTPRVAIVSNNPKIVCDAEIIDSCNSNAATKTSTVSVSVTISNNAYAASDVALTVEIGGFRSNRGQYKVIDPFTVVDLITIKS